MKVHKRQFKVATASNEMRQWLLMWQQRHELTDIEVLQSINEHTATMLKFMLREERHGDASKPAGVE